jgi:hypothetical protein
MNFKDFLEVKLDPNIVKINKQFPYGSDKPYIQKSFNIEIDNQGNITSDISNDSYYTISPQAKTIILQKTSPFIENFHKIIKALKKQFPDIETWKVEVYGQSGNMQTGRNKMNRNVAYYLKHKPINIKNYLPEFLYHGTCTNLYLSNIKKEGLKSRGSSSNLGSYGAKNIGAISRSNLVYLSVHPDAAARSASIQAAQRHGGKPLILKITTKNLFPEKFTFDEDAIGSNDAQDSINKMSTLAYKGRIPSSSIEPILVGIPTKNVYSPKWERYREMEMEDHPWTKMLNSGQKPWYGEAEYWIFKDAGIIDNEKILKNVTNDEVVNAIKKGGWAIILMKLQNDLNHRGILYNIQNCKVSKDISKEESDVLSQLIDSELFYIDSEGWIRLVSSYYREDKTIKLAKIIYNKKEDIEHFLNVCKEIEKNCSTY